MGSKFVVIKLSEVLKKFVLTVIGFAIIGGILYFCIHESGEEARYNPGIYSSEIILHNNPVSVQVTVSEDEITDIELLNMGETQAVFYPLFQQSINEISAEIIESQSTNIILSHDKSTTGGILLKAVDRALEEAKK